MRSSVLFLLILSLVIPIFAQKDLENLLERIQKDPVEMEFSLEIYWSVREKTEKKKGKLALSGEDNFDLTLNKSQWVSDGITVWQYSSKSEQLVIRSFLDMDFSLHPSTMFERFGKRSFDKVTEDESDIYRWSSESDPEYSRIDVKLSDDNQRFETILFVDTEENQSRYTFSEMKFVDSFSDDRFTFTAPEGAEVFDER